MEIYFCLHLTSTEHNIVQHDLTQECSKLGCKLHYYRQLKDGHIPMYREVKISGEPPQVRQVHAYLSKNLRTSLERNPHRNG